MHDLYQLMALVCLYLGFFFGLLVREIEIKDKIICLIQNKASGGCADEYVNAKHSCFDNHC